MFGKKVTVTTNVKGKYSDPDKTIVEDKVVYPWSSNYDSDLYDYMVVGSSWIAISGFWIGMLMIIDSLVY